MSLAFSITSRCCLKFLKISAPWSSVSNAILCVSCNLLLPSFNSCIPPMRRSLSLRSPYGSSEAEAAFPREPNKSVRELAAWASLVSFLYRLRSALTCLKRAWYCALIDCGIPWISTSSAEILSLFSHGELEKSRCLTYYVVRVIELELDFTKSSFALF